MKFEEFHKHLFVMLQPSQTGPFITPSNAHLITHHDYNDESDEQPMSEDEISDE